jgi:peptidoglycan/LPS O-acetylase OafA/YrhL
MINPRPAPKLRTEIEGLRALAILTVVLFHAKVPGFSGGYIGVDLFFVLSGYLISGLLLDERQRTGSIAFASFYARRARRLLPASAAMMLAVTVAGMLISAPSSQSWFAAGVSFASLYVSNIQFIRSGADYYAGVAERHPLLHTWSLSVEEQFYFVWPLAIAGVAYLVSRRDRLRASHLLAAITVAGFLAAEWALMQWPLVGFYFSAFRLWEFSAGALLAAYQRESVRKQMPGAQVAGWFGLALLLGSSSLMHSESIFPGIGALPTVVGTLLVLHATTGSAATPLHRLLSLAPFQTLGRLSYSIYLWHWPFLVYGAALIPYASVWHRMGLVIASAIVAELSFRFVESPLRHHAWLSVSPRRSIAAAILVTLAMAGIGAGWKFQANRWSQALDVKGGAWDASMASWPIRTQPPDATSAVAVTGGAPLGRERWVLLGDSHAEVWYPALSTLLATRGIRLEVFTKMSCPALLRSKRLQRRVYAACDAWQADALRQISQMKPAVLLLSSREEQPFPDHAWVDATQALLAGLNGSVAEVVILRGLATGPSSLPECLEAATWRGADGNDVCTLRIDPVDQGGYATVKRALEGQPGLRFQDWSEFFCAEGACKPRTASGEPLYFDSNHLSRPAVLEAVPAIEQRLVDAGLLPVSLPPRR